MHALFLLAAIILFFTTQSMLKACNIYLKLQRDLGLLEKQTYKTLHENLSS